MTRLYALATLALLACIPPGQMHNTTFGPAPVRAHATAPSTETPTGNRRVTFNGGALSRAGWTALTRLEAQYRRRIPDGAYWYDRVSGAAGRWGGPTLVFFPHSLPLGPSLPATASGGRTGLFINGRQVHAIEYRQLAVLVGGVPPRGRYWLDHRGNMGVEGGRAQVNLVALAKHRQATTRGRSRSRNWSVYQRGIGSRGSIGLAGDGKTTCVNTASYTRCY